MSKTASRLESANLDAVLRPAQRGDAAALAVLGDIAGEGLPAYLWNTLKLPGQSLLEFGRSRALREIGDFSHRNATVAEVAGEVAGALIGYRLEDPYEIGEMQEIPQALRPLILLEAQAPGSWYVNVLAVFPEFRSMGLGSRLLAAANDSAQDSGASVLSIIVASENARAARLYAHTGFREKARQPVIAFPGCPHGGDWILMTKPVDVKRQGKDRHG